MAYNKQDDTAAFMVRHEGKNGSYWKGYVDLGNGKGIRLMMFENTKDGAKSDFVVKLTGKTYDARKKQSLGNFLR